MAATALHLMKIQRDPAQEPQPGDKLRDPLDRCEREVLRLREGWVLVGQGPNCRGWQRLETWRKWAGGRRVKVVARGPSRVRTVPRENVS